MIEFVALNRSHTKARENFDCGEPILNEYLQRYAGQNVRRRKSLCFVLSDENVIYAYATILIVGSDETLQEYFQHRDRDVFFALIGRLAVDRRYQGQGFGKDLLIHIGNFVEKNWPVTALLVDAKNNTVASFYEKLGFSRIVPEGLRLAAPFPPRHL